ncbi:MAG: hypothetical protein N2043_12510 [Ignavibacterium sp.]|nr:hypothetical protein [Ignavibacterium sp.]
MKIIKPIIIFLVLNSTQLFGQEFYISGGMGLNFVTMEKLNDYLHYNWNFKNRRDESHSAIEFFGLVGSNLFPNTSIETGFGVSVNSFSNNYGIGIYQLEYTFYYPEINLLYDLNYTHYGLQFGFGLGYVLGSIDEVQPTTLQKITEETKGFYFQIKSTAFIALSPNLFTDVSFNYRLSFLNDLSFDGFIINRQPYERLNLSFNSFGLKIGVRYIL